ncbi:Tripeptidyl-peptidase sed1 [Lachnellula cervina]|uniref:Tripeptidyl-peptidase sed1 n=1 Tax=Lachnellula cervina TaxID=1316786 RepID=A0A7D8UUT6_9HELO|nr:Tripeptidyl-peptidase sed1 [Lachnellula cervina]
MSSRHDSPKYDQYYTPEEIISLFLPAQNSVNAITSWLQSAAIVTHRISQSVNKQWIQFNATVEAECLLKNEYYAWEHTSTDVDTPACSEYHVPAHVQEYVDYITTGLRLMTGSRKSAKGKSKRGFRAGSNKKFNGPILGLVLANFIKDNANIDPVYPDPLITGYQGDLQCGVYKPANVISISYREQEDDLPNN